MEPKPNSLCVHGFRRIKEAKKFEKLSLVLKFNTDPRIFHRNLYHAVMLVITFKKQFLKILMVNVGFALNELACYLDRTTGRSELQGI